MLKSIWFRSILIQFCSSLRPLLLLLFVLPLVMKYFDDSSISNYYLFTSIVAFINVMSNSNLIVNSIGKLTEDNFGLYLFNGIFFDYLVKFFLLLVFIFIFLSYFPKRDYDIFYALILQSLFLNFDSINSSILLIRNLLFKYIFFELVLFGSNLLIYFVMQEIFPERFSLLCSIVISSFVLFLLQLKYIYSIWDKKKVIDKSLLRFAFLNSSNSFLNSLAINVDRYFFYLFFIPQYYNSYSFAKQIWNNANTLSGGMYKSLLSGGKKNFEFEVSKSIAIFYFLILLAAIGSIFFSNSFAIWYSSGKLSNFELYLPVFMVTVLLRIIMMQDTLYLTMSSNLKLFLKYKSILSLFQILFFILIFLLNKYYSLNFDMFNLFIISLILANLDIFLILKFNNLKKTNHFFILEIIFTFLFIVVYYVWNFWI